MAVRRKAGRAGRANPKRRSGRTSRKPTGSQSRIGLRVRAPVRKYSSGEASKRAGQLKKRRATIRGKVRKGIAKIKGFFKRKR